MLFDQGVDPTSLLRSEGEVTVLQCKFRRIQIIVFDSK
jgi:hypothetical protein